MNPGVRELLKYFNYHHFGVLRCLIGKVRRETYLSTTLIPDSLGNFEKELGNKIKGILPDRARFSQGCFWMSLLQQCDTMAGGLHEEPRSLMSCV